MPYAAAKAVLFYAANRHDQGRALTQGSLRRLFQHAVKPVP
jgi:hypothetical protein